MKKLIAPLIIGLTPMMTLAQTNINPAENNNLVPLVAQNNQQGQQQGANNQNNSSLINSNQNFSQGSGNVLSIKMPQKGFWQKLREDTTFTYYQQFLGPTASGKTSETYNVFQAAGTGSEDRSGRAPIQSFHAVNLRHQINPNWAMGVSLAVSKGYAGDISNKNGDVNSSKDQFFNARAYVNLPAANFSAGSLFSTFSYEAPTSVISREQDMRFGWVIAESFALKMPSPKWTGGFTGQAYRMYYQENVRTRPTRFTGPGPLSGQICTGCDPTVTNMQTLILSAGPYLNYRMNDHWQAGSAVTLDWDQRGNQTGTTKFNNNLPHRARATLTYFPTTPWLRNVSNVGVFTQALLKFRPDTTAFGAEFSLRF